MAEQARSSRRRKRRSIVELMRGDIIRLVASSQINKNIYFIDYIDETSIRLIADMRTTESDTTSTFQNPNPVLTLELRNGRFPSEFQIESIELLYRNEKEQGYARQRGLVPGKWIEIEYITEDEIILMVYGEIVSLPDDTDCIGISVYMDQKQQEQERTEAPIIYIDFEFKGLSEDLHIRSIKVCNKPKSLVKEQEEVATQKQREKIDQAREEEKEQEEIDDAQKEEQDQDEETQSQYAKVNLEFQKSPPGPIDRSPAQQVLIDEGDRIAITFGSSGEDDASPVVFIKEVSRYYSLEEQQQQLLEALIDMAPTSKSHHLASTKEYGRMIERYTQLRETYSVQTDHGNLVRRPYYGDGFKPMMHALLVESIQKDGMDFNFTNDWLMPIYVQKRIMYCMDAREETLFENSSDAEIINAVDRIIKDQTEYEQYDTGKSYFSAYLNNIRMNTTPYSISDDTTTLYKPLFKSSSLQCFSTGASNVKSMLVPAFNKSKTWSTCFNMCRYIGGDSIPEYPAGFMVRPYPFVYYSSMKSHDSTIMDKTNAHLITESSDPLGTSSYHWWSLGSGSFGDNGIDERIERACASMFKKHSVDLRPNQSEKDLVPYHERFANTMQTEMYFSKKFNQTALYNMVPFTEELANKVMSYYKNYYTALTPHILIKSLSPFFIQPEHITQQTFSIFSAFIREHVKVFKSTMKFMKRKYEAYESFAYTGFGTGNGPSINAIYALLTDPKVAKSIKVIEESSKSKSTSKKDASSQNSVFDTTVVSKYPIKEWMVKGGDQQKILSNSEVLSRMFFVDFGRCLMNEVIQLNMIGDNNLYGVNVTGVIEHFVSEAEKAAGVVNAVKDATDVKTGNKEPKNGKFILAKRYENMGDLNADNEASPHVPISYDVAYDSTDYEFIRKYEKERRNMPEDVFKAFLIDKFQHMQQTKRKQKMTVVECAFEVDSMISGRRLVRAGSKDRAVVEFSGPVSLPGEATGEDSTLNMDAYDPKPNPNPEEGEGEGGVSKEYRYRYYKLRSNGTWELDDTIPTSITPENTEFFGNIVPGAIVMKNNCLSTDTGITAESSTVVTSLAKANLISKITHEFDGIIETKQDEFQKVFSEKVDYYYYRLGAEMVIQIKKQMDAMNKQYRLGQDAKARHDAAASTSVANMAISPHRDILNAYLGNGSFPRMQELIISFAQNYTRKANRPCVGTPAPTEHSSAEENAEAVDSAIETESCEWLYCKDSGAKLMPTWLLEKASAYINDSSGELSYVNVMDRICRDYGVIEGAVWVDGKKCKSGLVIMPLAFSTYEGIDEQGFKIKSHSVISMDDDDDILLGGAKGGRRDDDDNRLQEQAYIQRINSKFENSSAHKINDIVTPVLKLGLGIAPDRNGLRQRIITSVIHTISKLNDSLFMSEKVYAAENSQKKAYPSYESYRDRVIVMTTLAHIIVVIQSTIPDIRPSKTFRNCKTTFRGFPLDSDGGGDKCIEYIACIATGIKDASKDVWIPVLSFKVDRYVSDIKTILKKILKDETDGHLDKMLTDKRSYLQQEMLRETQLEQYRQNTEDRVQKWTQFLPLPYELKVRAPEPVTREMQSSFLKALKNGTHSQHEQMDVLHSKIMHYSLYIQNLIQDWIKTGGGGKVSLILFTDDHRPATENACCDDMILASPRANASPENKSASTVLEYLIMHANGNIREFNWQIERLGKELAMVNRSSKSYILSIDPSLAKQSSLELSTVDPFSKSAAAVASYPYSVETIIRGFIHFFKLDYPNAYIHPKLESLRGQVPENYDPRAEFSDKMVKLKTSNMEDRFSEVLETVNRVSMLDAPSTLGGDGKNLFELKSFVKRNQMFPSSAIADHVRHFANVGISPETIFKLMKKYSIPDGAVMTDALSSDIFDSIKELDIYDPFKYTLTELIPEMNIFSEDIRSGLYEIVDSVEMEEISRLQDSVLEMLSNACEVSRSVIRANIVEDRRPTALERRTGKDKHAASSPEQVMEFIELLDRYEGDEMYENKRTLHHSRDESGPAIFKFIAFIKNAVRFMLQTVPGLLITSETGNDKDKYVSSKHWKFGTAHNTDISTCIDVQYTGLSMFRDDPEIMRHMRTMDTGSVHKNAGYMILQLVNTIPFALDGRNKLSVDLVKKLYTYLFYKTIELYVGNESSGSGSVFMARERERERQKEGGNLSVIGNIDSGILRDEFVFLSDGIAPRAKRRELLIAVMGNVIKMKSHNSVSTVEMREIMAGIRRKETEDMRYAFYMTSASTKTDAFQIKKTMLKLRIGEYSVGAQVGYRKYDRDFDERERDARNARLAEGGGDPNLSVEAFEDDIRKQTESNGIVDGQQAIAPMDGDEFDRDQLMRNEIEIINAC